MSEDLPPDYQDDELVLTLLFQLSTLRDEVNMLRNGIAAILLLVNGEKIKLNLPEALGVDPDNMEGIVRVFNADDDPKASRH